MNLPQPLTLKAATISATPPMIIMMPTIMTAEAVAATALPSAMKPAIRNTTPSATIHPHLARRTLRPSARLGGSGVLVDIVMALLLQSGMDNVRIHPPNGTVAGCMGSFSVTGMQEEMTEPKKEGAAPRPATTVLLLRPSQPGDAGSPLEVFMVVRHHQIDSFSGALVFPGGKLEEADGAPSLRARCGGADKIDDAELKFRVAGVREAFEECGVLLARKRGQRALIGAADLKGIEERWRAKLAKDEASIVDMVEAEDLEIATELMTPYAHWITPTFVPKRFDTWFFLAEAPEDQIALHDGSESTDSVWIGPQEAIEEAKAGKRTLVHATTKNLELLAEGKTVAGAISAASARTIVTVQPWVEEKDGKKFLHIPEGAGYRNLVREMPPSGGVPQTGR